MANASQGKGFESERVYAHSKVVFLGIPNIHVVRNSLRALRSVCAEYGGKDPSDWRRQVGASRWFEVQDRLLDAALYVVRLVALHRASALVRCSDGWDRTPQVLSLVQLLVDPWYRTLNGFLVLLLKDWCLFGHQFGLRCGQGRSAGFRASQRAPIFLQFLDAVYQLTVLFPSQFEFNEVFLLVILDQLNLGAFLMLLGDSVRDRAHLAAAVVDSSGGGAPSSEAAARGEPLDCADLRSWLLSPDLRPWFTNPLYPTPECPAARPPFLLWAGYTTTFFFGAGPGLLLAGSGDEAAGAVDSESPLASSESAVREYGSADLDVSDESSPGPSPVPERMPVPDSGLEPASQAPRAGSGLPGPGRDQPPAATAKNLLFPTGAAVSTRLWSRLHLRQHPQFLLELRTQYALLTQTAYGARPSHPLAERAQ